MPQISIETDESGHEVATIDMTPDTTEGQAPPQDSDPTPGPVTPQDPDALLSENIRRRQQNTALAAQVAQLQEELDALTGEPSQEELARVTELTSQVNNLTSQVQSAENTLRLVQLAGQAGISPAVASRLDASTFSSEDGEALAELEALAGSLTQRTADPVVNPTPGDGGSSSTFGGNYDGILSALRNQGGSIFGSG